MAKSSLPFLWPSRSDRGQGSCLLQHRASLARSLSLPQPRKPVGHRPRIVVGRGTKAINACKDAGRWDAALSLLSEVPRLADLCSGGGGGQLERLQPTLVTFTCKTEVLSCGLQADLITFNAAPELLAEARADLRP